MTNLIKSLLLISMIASQVLAVDKQFALDDHNYVPFADQGFDQYKAKSLYKTKKIALTFDDGPHQTLTPRLLDILKKYDVKATFFVLTRKFNKKNRSILERILKEGHHLASHDHDHDNNNNETESRYYQELKDSVEYIKDIERSAGVKQNGIYYRFPYGAYGRNKSYHHMNVMKDVGNDVFGSNCINFAFWDIDSADWGSSMTPKKIAQNIVAHVNGGKAYRIKKTTSIFGKPRFKIKKFKINHPLGGGVALLHDIHERSILATELLLKRAKQEGIKIVPLSDVKEYSYKNKSCYLE